MKRKCVSKYCADAKESLSGQHLNKMNMSEAGVKPRQPPKGRGSEEVPAFIKEQNARNVQWYLSKLKDPDLHGEICREYCVSKEEPVDLLEQYKGCSVGDIACLALSLVQHAIFIDKHSRNRYEKGDVEAEVRVDREVDALALLIAVLNCHIEKLSGGGEFGYQLNGEEKTFILQSVLDFPCFDRYEGEHRVKCGADSDVRRLAEFLIA